MIFKVEEISSSLRNFIEQSVKLDLRSKIVGRGFHKNFPIFEAIKLTASEIKVYDQTFAVICTREMYGGFEGVKSIVFGVDLDLVEYYDEYDCNYSDLKASIARLGDYDGYVVYIVQR